MKFLIVTRSDSNYREISNVTHPIIKIFAEKWNAKFLVLDEHYDYPNCPGWYGRFYRILHIYDLFTKYDRILHIDSDVIINKNCPNIFEVVPSDKIGTVYEDVGTRKKDRYNRIKEAQKYFGEVGWKKNYINMGLFLASKQHRNIFQPIDNKLWFGRGSGDIVVGYNIKKYNYEVYELPYKYNHMKIFSEPWNKEANRFDSFIIHYAGKGLFDRKKFSKKKFKYSRIEQIKHDYKKIYESISE